MSRKGDPCARLRDKLQGQLYQAGTFSACENGGHTKGVEQQASCARAAAGRLTPHFSRSSKVLFTDK